MAVKFPAGRYYVGDLCYVINEKDWDELLAQSGCLGYDFGSDQWFGMFKGYKVFSGSTAHGDGHYPDNFGNGYAVDSGTIGIIDANWLDGKEAEIEALGVIHEFREDFEVLMPERGLFHFGDVTIVTDDWAEEDYCPECNEHYLYCRCDDEEDE